MAEEKSNSSPRSPAAGGETEASEIARLAEEAIAGATAQVQNIAGASVAAARSAASPASSQPFDLPDFSSPASNSQDPAGLGLLEDVTLKVKVELGRTRMYVEDVLRLNANSVVELDKAAGDPVDIYVNDRHVARGEVLVLNENFCVRVSEIIQQVGEDD